LAALCTYSLRRDTGNVRIADREQAASCILAKYQERLTELKEVGQRFGPFVLNRIDLYSATPVAAEPGATSSLSTRHVAYPKIDHATLTPALDWNRGQVKSIAEAGYSDSGDDGSGLDDTDYSLSFVNDIEPVLYQRKNR
jgi:hypothetical protein